MARPTFGGAHLQSFSTVEVTTFISDSWSVAAGETLLVAVHTNSVRRVTSLTGFGLTWTSVLYARSATTGDTVVARGIEVFKAVATATTSAAITANVNGSAGSYTAIHGVRIAGASPTITEVVEAHTTEVDQNNDLAVSIDPSTTAPLIVGFANHRAVTFTVPAPQTSIDTFDMASSGSRSRGTAFHHSTNAGAAVTMGGTDSLSAAEDWVVIAIALAEAADIPAPPAPPASTGEMLMPTTELMALPASGAAWNAMLNIANGTWNTDPGGWALNIEDSHNVKAGARALAGALVYARNGDTAMRTKVRDAIFSAIATMPVGTTVFGNSGLGPMRQVPSYILCADLIELTGQDLTDYKAWVTWFLDTPAIGTHGPWGGVTKCSIDSHNNWWAWAIATRVAGDIYLGRTADLATCWALYKGFMGDRTAYSDFDGQDGVNSSALGADAATWACDATPAGFVPVNPACVKSGVDVNGAIPEDIARSGPLIWPPGTTGMGYQLELMTGAAIAAELLYRNGYPTAWSIQSDVFERMGDFVSRSGAASGPTWNYSSVSYYLSHLLNYRYGTTYPTVPAFYGRSFGYTDWLYGQQPAGPATANFYVSGGRGHMSVDPGLSRTAILGGTSFQDVTLTVKVRTDKLAAGANYGANILMRYANENYYFARLIFDTTGTLSLSLRKVVSGTDTLLQEVVIPGTHVAGTDYTIKAQVVGINPTALRAKAWRSSEAEPPAWQRETSDTTAILQASGAVGLGARVNAGATNAPVTFSFDEFLGSAILTPPIEE